MDFVYDVVIIGGGPAGYTAALYAVRAGLSTLLIEKYGAGGQMAQTDRIDNYPGFPEGIDGFQLGENMKKSAVQFGAKTVTEEVIAVHLQGNPKSIQTKKNTYTARSVIVATGAAHRRLGLPNELDLVGKGVSYCATCDGMFYRGKTVAVVGGGNTAAEDALLLSRICKQVILIHRRNALRASQVYVDQIQRTPNITVFWDTEVTSLLQDKLLTGVKLINRVNGEQSAMPISGLFVSVGMVPQTSLFLNQLALDPSGYIIADETTQTNLAGVFAAGDVRQKAVRQIVTATADGAVAVHFAQEYLASLSKA